MMSKELHYDKSPLTEAVIDLRVELPEEVTLDVLARLQSGQDTAYPTVKRHFETEVQFTEPGVEPSTIQRQAGYVFTSEDGRQVVQVRLNGFTFSRLAPYENWNSFRDEARRWWDNYRNATRPEAITRTAVRYINRLDLPLPVTELKDYLKTVPEVSSDLPFQDLSGYFMQLQIPQTDIGAMLILNEALVPPPPSTPNVVSVLLDIDLSRNIDLPSDEETLWSLFEQFRVRKNEIFEGCITDSTRRLIT